MARPPSCFHFGPTTDGDATQRDLLGGKGANLAEMARIGLPVPPGFTITTRACASYLKKGQMPRGLMKEVRRQVRLLEEETGKTFGRGPDALLLSVRSGAAVSMPGMMDTVLDLGLDDTLVDDLATAHGDARFAWDAYRRFIQMFGDVVLGLDHERFERALREVKVERGARIDSELSSEALHEVVRRFRTIVGKKLPQDPWSQLEMAIEAVFRSWNKPSAQTYRRIHGIEGLPGTAVNVQAMVYGNLGPDSGSGVAFTRNPATGDNRLYGEYLENAQGEDVVAGIRTPTPLRELRSKRSELHAELEGMRQLLESHFADMQDFEFTVERGELFMLQTRTGKRTGSAAVTIAVDMVKEGLIDRDTALLRVPAGDIPQLLLPSFDVEARQQAERLARGLPASPGAAAGRLAFSAEEAVARAEAGEAVLLVRRDTSPEDVDGMHVAAGVLTSTGGMTSHAAVVARGWGKCCIAGASALSIDEARRELRVGDRLLGPDDVISLDGSTGEVFLGDIPRSAPAGITGHLATLLGWADERARLLVRANADTPDDAERARSFGAQGIGLCRTEHMFFGDARIAAMRRMILADGATQRREALAALLPLQRDDFEGLFRAMRGRAVTVRLLDPPLHEFLPHGRAAIAALAKDLGVPPRVVESRVQALHESNPMMGHRGCRLAITYPEIAEMQATAITEAAIACRRERVDIEPQIMIPLVGLPSELSTLRAQVEATIEAVKKKLRFRGKLHIPVGTMIEIPRAALVADTIAEHADFFSFGTNDLTQLTFGFSRDDVGTFLPGYRKQGLLPQDPFASIDTDGVGQLVATATSRGRATHPGLEVGVCGEHGGDPASIHFFHQVGLDYVSCSPFRVPVARLAAAQAALTGDRPGPFKRRRRGAKKKTKR